MKPYLIVSQSTQGENITVFILYTPNNKASKYVMQNKWTKMKK